LLHRRRAFWILLVAQIYADPSAKAVGAAGSDLCHPMGADDFVYD
jgi:hypothetical protein